MTYVLSRIDESARMSATERDFVVARLSRVSAFYGAQGAARKLAQAEVSKLLDALHWPEVRKIREDGRHCVVAIFVFDVDLLA